MRGVKSLLWVAAVALLGLNSSLHALDRVTGNIRLLQTMSDGFSELAAQVKPGVVAIATEIAYRFPML